jgi:hypothetical protein
VVACKLETDALMRRVRTNTAEISGVNPRGDDIFFTSGAIWQVSMGSNRARSIYPGGFNQPVWSAGTLYANSVEADVALRCP